MKHNIGDELLVSRPSLSSKMSSYKLNNGAVLAITLDYEALNKEGQPVISDAELMFGSKFAEPKKGKKKGSRDDDDDDDDDEYSERQSDVGDDVQNKMHGGAGAGATNQK